MHAAAFLAGLIGAPLVYTVAVGAITLLATGTLVFVPAMTPALRSRASCAGRTPPQRRMRLGKIISKVQCSVESADYGRAPISAEKRISTCAFLRCPGCRTARRLNQGKSRLERR
ncbi:MAG: hypothetical protein Q8K85_11245 [Hyphomicrobium sp.]|nr:hypothetical protein [Hyphomicrobium sp.]